MSSEIHRLEAQLRAELYGSNSVPVEVPSKREKANSTWEKVKAFTLIYFGQILMSIGEKLIGKSIDAKLATENAKNSLVIGFWLYTKGTYMNLSGAKRLEKIGD